VVNVAVIGVEIAAIVAVIAAVIGGNAALIAVSGEKIARTAAVEGWKEGGGTAARQGNRRAILAARLPGRSKHPLTGCEHPPSGNKHLPARRNLLLAGEAGGILTFAGPNRITAHDRASFLL